MKTFFYVSAAGTMVSITSFMVNPSVCGCVNPEVPNSRSSCCLCASRCALSSASCVRQLRHGHHHQSKDSIFWTAISGLKQQELVGVAVTGVALGVSNGV